MRLVHNIFEPKASRIIRCLLVNVSRDWTIREMAVEANTSVGYTHAVLATLEKMEYVVRNERHKLVLLDPLTLVKRWAGFHQYKYVNKFLDYYTFQKEIDAFLTNFKTKLKNEKYSLTSLAGVWLVSANVRPVDIHFYVDDEKSAERIFHLLNIKPTAGVGNIRMVIPYDHGVFYGSRQIQGVKVVSNVQLFVDLLNYSARGEEAAQHLYDLIRKKWSKHLIGG